MKTRDVTIFSGHTFSVPQGIQRIDTRATHGWQVRYQGTKFFADGAPDGSRAETSLDAAKRHLLSRIATMPAPVVLQHAPSVNKSSDLPPGISGPILRPPRKGSRVRSAVLSVLLPRFGQTARVRTIYIGSEKTYTESKFQAAVEKAVVMRAEVIEKYETTATSVKRQKGRAMLAEMRAARRAA